ncbi:MAG TPA: hypothetical protein VIL60_09900 [Rhodanobacter sp.]
MSMVRFRLTGSRSDADAVIADLHGLDGIEHVEEVDDLATGMRDDSSSCESPSDAVGHVYCIEVEVFNDQRADIVRGDADAIAHEFGAGIEFTDEF